jgi:hypothetical protein
LFISWCVGDKCDMVGSDENHGRSRRPGTEDSGWSSIGRVLGGRMIPCVVYTMHKETKSTGFLVWPQNQGRRFPGLGFKTDGSGLVIWASKSLRWFSGLGFKIGSSSLVI